MSEGTKPSLTPTPGTTAWRLWKRVGIALIVVAVFLFLSRRSTESEEVSNTGVHSKPVVQVAIQSVEDLTGRDDPVLLMTAGKYWLREGNQELARACFEAAIENDEINNYTRFAGKPPAQAYLSELMGDFESSRRIWREFMYHDLPSAMYFIAHYSIDSQRHVLLDDAQARVRVRALLAKTSPIPFEVKGKAHAKKGGFGPHAYTTKKGQSRRLRHMSQENLAAILARSEVGADSAEKPVKMKYVYIETLDLTGKHFDKRVSCTRCIIGQIKGYDSRFDDQLDLTRTIVIGSAHFGKKWKGKVNKSKSFKASQFERLMLNNSVFMGAANFDSVSVNGRYFYLPLTAFLDDVDMRSVTVRNTMEFRFGTVLGALNLGRTRLHGFSYFGGMVVGSADLTRLEVDNQIAYFNSAHFRGPVKADAFLLRHGLTLENARFDGPVNIKNGKLNRTLNMSRTVFNDAFYFQNMKVEDCVSLGARFESKASFDDSVFFGRVTFSLDTFKRAEHRDDAGPLESIYKQYQGDDDAPEPLTTTPQYGVQSVDDLITRFNGPSSFANVTFSKSVTFERVTFAGSGTGRANFFNTQFEGEAHFEDAIFKDAADFRTIAANELSFNNAQFGSDWLMDDANVLGRLAVTDAELATGATLSTYGADISSFGIELNQLANSDDTWNSEDFRLFYLQCLMAGEQNEQYWADDRLKDARWDREKDQAITDEVEIRANVERLCVDRAIGEFTLLRDSFSGRSMLDESDWAYWHLKHYRNHKESRYASNIFAYGLSIVNWILFEKAFGWGVLLHNLFITLLVTVIVFVFLHLWLCPDLVVMWDGEAYQYKDLPWSARILLSTSAFLVDSGLSAALVPEGKKWWKFLYTAEVAVGIIVVTFFIGAYTRLVVSG